MPMDVKEMITAITRELLAQMAQEQKLASPKVLYLFCDSTAHEPFLDQFITLKNHGICHDLLFLDGETSSWLGMHRIECGGAGKLIAIDEYAPAPLEVPSEYDAIIVPEIDLDNAARVASGMKGTVKAEIVLAALVTGKPVFVGEDAPGIKRTDRRTLQTVSLPPAYQALFARHLSAMRELGVQLRPQRQLAEDAIAWFRKQELLPATEQRQPGQAGEPQEEPEFAGRLLTAEWLRANLTSTTSSLVIKKGAIVSPLAADMLREKGIALQFISKG
ncbi:hypothetical protein [Brevibacillus fluminis]